MTLSRLDKYFIYKCEKGLKERGLSDKQEYVDRLKYEIDVITRMQFSGYFLVTWDFVKYAKNKNILVCPGRGSGGGSLVCYCLKITELDPIKWDLLFERFMNPDRIGRVDFSILQSETVDTSDLTTDTVLDILESGEHKDARFKDLKRMCSVSQDI